MSYYFLIMFRNSKIQRCSNNLDFVVDLPLLHQVTDVPYVLLIFVYSRCYFCTSKLPTVNYPIST